MTTLKVRSTARRNRRDVGYGADPAGLPIEDGIADHVICFRQLRQGDNGSSPADDPGLLSCNFSDRVAKKFLMIQ